MSRVLVTGGTGFVAAHILVRLLNDGHEVRSTVRSLSRRPALEAMLRRGGADPDGLVLFEADLNGDAGWQEAVAGCDYVLHVASPFPSEKPEDENELVRPARDGALRVLRAARDAGVKRVVMTSSFAAIGYGHEQRQGTFDETDWSRPDAPDVDAYIKSKIVAERAAWDFIASEGGGLELSAINPTGIFGPVLGKDFASSIGIVDTMLKGGMPFVPNISFGVVDVRDVAELHLIAMTHEKAAGERFLAVSGEPVSLKEIADILHQRLGAAAARAPKRQMPDWLVRLMALLVSDLRGTLPLLGLVRRATSQKARDQLGWRPRPAADTITDTARSLIALESPDTRD